MKLMKPTPSVGGRGRAGVVGCMADMLTPEARLRRDLAIARRIAIDAGSGAHPSIAIVLQVYEALSRERARGRYALPALDPMDAFVQHLAADTSRGANKVRQLLGLLKTRSRLERREATALLGTDAAAVLERVADRASRLRVDFRAFAWTDRYFIYAGPALEAATIPWSMRGTRTAAPKRELGDEVATSESK